MKNLISILLIVLCSASCSLIQTRKMTIEQGNLITQDEVKQLRTGMSSAQVKAILGAPIMVNVFSHSQVVYVYTQQVAHQPRREIQLICHFNGGRLQHFEQKES